MKRPRFGEEQVASELLTWLAVIGTLTYHCGRFRMEDTPERSCPELSPRSGSMTESPETEGPGLTVTLISGGTFVIRLGENQKPRTAVNDILKSGWVEEDREDGTWAIYPLSSVAKIEGTGERDRGFTWGAFSS
jgi:hypothetical protein